MTTQRPLSLHHLVLQELDAVALIHLAKRFRCEYVCLFTQMPGDAKTLPIIRDVDIDRVQQALNETGVRVHGITSFPILPGVDVQDYAQGLARGQALGAQLANIRILEPDRNEATRKLAELAALCDKHGLKACVEFTGYNAPHAVRETAELIRDAGGGFLTVDALHLVRSQAPWSDLKLAEVGYIQLCDGPRHASEEVYGNEGPLDRLSPGEGDFPLAELMQRLPDDLPVCLEIPSQSLRKQGLGHEAIAQHLVQTTRRWLETLT